MATAAWREEKSATIVKSICRMLSQETVSQEVKDAMSGEVLWNALKLYADALEERLDCERTKWSPGVVTLFRSYPARCDEWLSLMAEDEFSAEEYREDLGGS